MIRSSDRSFDKHPARRRARLRAQAALFACMAALAFATFILLNTHGALAQDAEDASDLDATAVAAPEGIIGEPPPAFLEADARDETSEQDAKDAPEGAARMAEGSSAAPADAAEITASVNDALGGAAQMAEGKPSYNLSLPKRADTGLVYNGTRQQGYGGVPVVRILADNGVDEMDYHAPLYVEYKGINGTVYNSPPVQAAGYQQINTYAPINAGTYQVIFTVPESQSFTLNPSSFEFSIAKAPAPALSQPSVTLFDAPGSVMEFDLSSMIGLPSDLNGGPSYAITGFTETGLASAAVDPATGKLTLTANDRASRSVQDTVTVALTDMGNYEDCAVQVAVSYVTKPSATIAGVKAATDLVYNGEPQQGYTGSPQATYRSPLSNQSETYNGPFVITYTGTASDGSAFGPTTQAPTAPGTYRVEFSAPEAAPFTGSLALDFSIGKSASGGPDPTKGSSLAPTGGTLAATGDGLLPGLFAAVAGAAILAALIAGIRLIAKRRS